MPLHLRRQNFKYVVAVKSTLKFNLCIFSLCITNNMGNNFFEEIIYGLTKSAIFAQVYIAVVWK